jgi:hypothetical protein
MPIRKSSLDRKELCYVIIELVVVKSQEKNTKMILKGDTL